MATVTNSGSDVTIRTSSILADPDAPYALVNERFEEASLKADQMLQLLVGEDGTGGYLGAMESAISSSPATLVVAPFVDTAASVKSATSVVPVFDRTKLGEYPNESYTVPVLSALPGIDTTGLDGSQKPEAISADFTWSEEYVPVEVYDALLAKILENLREGSTGVDPEVEAAIYARARARQQEENENLYESLHNEWMGKQFQLPSGSLANALEDFYARLAQQVENINNDILIAQGNLAQQNGQAVLQTSVAIEQLLRQAAGDRSTRSLEYKKARADILVRTYSEEIKAYIADLEGEKVYIEAQVEELKGVIESNRAKVDVYREQYAALAVQVGAVASKNQSLVDVFRGEMQGYEAEERGVASANASTIEMIKAKIAAAENEVRAAISNAEQAVSGYASEMSLRERIATAKANIAMQSVASWAGAVNASASLGYSGNESRSTSSSESVHLGVSHSFEHDPLA